MDREESLYFFALKICHTVRFDSQGANSPYLARARINYTLGTGMGSRLSGIKNCAVHDVSCKIHLMLPSIYCGPLRKQV